MSTSERIAVVGAGIIGSAVAFELSQRGTDVVIFDARGVGGGATQASAGILAPYTEAHHDPRLFDLTVRGLASYEDFVSRVRSVSRMPFEFRRSGTLEVAEDESRAEELQTRLQETSMATARLEWLDRRALISAAPFVRPDAVGGLLCSAHAYVAVRAFTTAIADAAFQLGARFVLDNPVQSIEVSAPGISIRTPLGEEPFDRVILCAGAWTPALDPIRATRGRITPIRGQLVRLKGTPGELDRILWSRACYLVPWEDGTILVGATSEDAGFNESPTAGGVRELLTAAADLVPGVASATFLDVLVGLRPASATGLPILGPASDPRIVYATGHYRNGILLAPLTAQLLGDFILDGTRDPVFAPG